jgi:hypothetical protein
MTQGRKYCVGGMIGAPRTLSHQQSQCKQRAAQNLTSPNPQNAHFLTKNIIILQPFFPPEDTFLGISV